jgi:acyl carrier protein
MSTPASLPNVVHALRRFVASELLFEPDPEKLAPDASLSALGVLDSTSILELIDFIEAEFDVIISLDAITSQTFDTLNNITETVMAHLSSRPTASTAGSASTDSP